MITLYTYKGKCFRVLDGDTIRAMVDLGFNVHISVTIRLSGINAPETRTRNLEEKEKGLKSKQRLITILEENENEFTFVSHGIEKFGRCLADIYVKTLGEMTVQENMINEGFGKKYNGEKR